MKEAVVIFGKAPMPGRVKTRLSPAIGEEMAARLYEAFARDVFDVALHYQAECHLQGRSTRLVLAWEGAEEGALVRSALERGFELVEQGSGDLGERLKRVAGQLRGEGVEQILILGTDSPTVMTEQLHLARLMLDRVDVVFGPCFDGGYFLVGLGPQREGLCAAEEAVFDKVSWSTAEVLKQSWERAERAGLLSELLGFWYDVDTFEDLKYLHFHLIKYLKTHHPRVGQFTREFLESSPRLGLS